MNTGIAILALTWLAAPTTDQQVEPRIVTHATGQIEVSPDHVVLDVGAMFTEESATIASERLATTLTAILDTLARLGFSRDSLPTSSFTVASREDFTTGTITGYDARSEIRVTVRDIGQTGQVVDAVMAAGANQLGALQFGVADERDARDSAIALAVASARRDAEVLARAAGGGVGRLLELTINTRPAFGGSLALSELLVSGNSRQASSFPVTPSVIVVSVFVSATWEYVPN